MSGHTPWTDREARARAADGTPIIYGVNRAEMMQLRAEGASLLANREDAGVITAKVEAFFRRNGHSTARRVAGSLNLRIADARSAIARLVENETLIRDGDLWEKSTQTGHRYAAAYKLKGDE